jgi:hypothetical protein
MSNKITFRSGPERGDWLAVYRDSMAFWRGRAVHEDTAHEYACADADRAVAAMQERGEVGHG